MDPLLPNLTPIAERLARLRSLVASTRPRRRLGLALPGEVQRINDMLSRIAVEVRDLEQAIAGGSPARTLEAYRAEIAAHLPAVLKLELLVDGHVVSVADTEGRDKFELHIAVPDATPGPRRIFVQANTFMVPHDLWGNNDFRPLSFRLRDLRFI
jgi:hypothetical protein